MNELALFAGAGGGILGGHLLGWHTVCAVEWEPYAAGVLVARQNDGILPAFPVWDDVQTFDGRPWRGLVDVVSGGFPCQDISAAGGGKGIEGERSGMWKHMARIVGEVLPRFVFVENSPLLVGRGLAVVLGDLADLGYDAQWFRLSASDCGAPHQRDRCWLVGNADGLDGRSWWPWGLTDASARQPIAERQVFDSDADQIRRDRKGQPSPRLQPGSRRDAWSESASLCGDVADTDKGQRNGAPCQVQTWRNAADVGGSELCPFCGYQFDVDALGIYGCPNCEGDGIPDGNRDDAQGLEQKPQPRRYGRPDRLQDRAGSHGSGHAWPAEPDVGRVADGVAARVDRLKALGNGQVPRVAATAFAMLSGK